MSRLKVSAPSNIALIKYMGKINHERNFPTNTSISYTLNHLRSWVELELNSDLQKDEWVPLAGYADPQLNQKGMERFLAHAAFVKQQLGVVENFVVRSANDFPGDCGLASSASSFAALTLALGTWAKEHHGVRKTPAELATLSQKGSGSSCRSFFSPWAIWSEDRVEPIDLGFDYLLHQVVVVHDERKEVSSSEAHRRVAQSSLFAGRPERANQRATGLIEALRQKDWRKIYEICWIEFQDMHALFETCSPPFGYMHPKSLEVLTAVRAIWNSQGDGPVVTMDAGPNVHLLWRPDQELPAKVFESTWKVRHRVFSSGVDAP